MLRLAVAVLVVIAFARGENGEVGKAGWQQQPEHHGWEQPKQHGWEQQQHHEPEHHGWEQPKHDGWQQPEHHGWEQPKSGWEAPPPKHYSWGARESHNRGWHNVPPTFGNDWGYDSDGSCCDEIDLAAFCETDDTVDPEVSYIRFIEARKESSVATDGTTTYINSELFFEVTREGPVGPGAGLGGDNVWYNGPRTYLRPAGRFFAEVNHLPPAECQEAAAIVHSQYLLRDCEPSEAEALVHKRQGWSNDDDEEELDLQLSALHVSSGSIFVKEYKHDSHGYGSGHSRSYGWSSSSSYSKSTGFGKASCCTEYPEGVVIGDSGQFEDFETSTVAVRQAHVESQHGEDTTFYIHYVRIADCAGIGGQASK